ncbi:2-hydroxychromene-2-carboxylate isomerase [Roseixanthobacter glucoisosaccharinicivorans]|uniref:2-hydroxychromene-2-carboxylate isomerase n=1 Tax=Roseixanthobacter glucoisosaccharinicivorans TaxID=3119923 RepID=UPI00372CE720
MSDTTSDAIDYYFWINSDWAYFGNPRLKDMAERYGLPVNYYPVDIGAVYARTGGIKLPLRSKERRDYRFLEMRRFRDILGMPINLEPKYMTQSVEIPSRFAIAAIQMGMPPHDLIHAIMTALWVEERDIEDEATLVSIASDLGLDGAAILEHSKGKAAAEGYYQNTDRAVESGMFGAPFYVFRGEGFWGQDRLAMLDDTIARALGKAPVAADLKVAS